MSELMRDAARKVKDVEDRMEKRKKEVLDKFGKLPPLPAPPKKED